MTFNVILSCSAALICVGLAVFVFLKERRSFTHQVFAFGMIAFAGEALLNGLSFRTYVPSEIVYWQRLRLIATAIKSRGRCSNLSKTGVWKYGADMEAA
jgi:hypothetical protein